MSLHPGEKGFCGKEGHGLYDEFCDKCTYEKRQPSLNRRSIADRREPAPTGTGSIVLNYVAAKIGIQIDLSSLPTALPPLTDPVNLKLLLAELVQRAETGKQKYGTYLRVDNGRDCEMDLYQELCDAIMYAAQAHMEGKPGPGSGFVEILVQLASQIAGHINKRG